MSMSAGEMIDFSAKHLHEDPNDAVVTDLSLDWINLIKDQVVTFGQWKWLEMWGQLSIPTTGVVYFPDNVWQILSLFPSNFGYRRPVQFLGARQFDDAGPSVSAGLSDYAMEWGYYGVSADVGTEGVITVATDSGSGDDGMQIVAEGLDASRNEQYETITISGASTAGTATWLAGVDGVRRIYINRSTNTSSLTQGIITVTDAGGSTIERLDSSREIDHQHIRAELYPTTSGPAFSFRAWRRVPDVIARNNIIGIPREYKDIFQYGLLSLVRDFQGAPGESDRYAARMMTRLTDMKFNQERQPGRRRGVHPNRSYRNPAWRW